ncbi:MAG: AAA family ATPase [Clostridia bacterium]
MESIVCFINQKEGVGKSTTVFQIAAGLTKRRKKVLMLDIDPQASLTTYLGMDCNVDKNMYTFITGKSNFEDTIVRTASGDLIPSSLELGFREIELVRHLGCEFMLSSAIGEYCKNYDYVLIDCPSSTNIFLYNALMLSTHAVLVMQANCASTKWIGEYTLILDNVFKFFKKKVKFASVIMTRLNERYSVHKVLSEQMSAALSERNVPVLKSKIKNSEVVFEANACHRSLLDYAPTNDVTIQYDNAVDELIAIISGDKKALRQKVQKQKDI